MPEPIWNLMYSLASLTYSTPRAKRMDMGICIRKLALNSEFSDIRIVVGQDGEVFPAHKLILAARCEYFRKMFYGTQMKEARDGVCTFLYDDPRVFKTMIYHLYAKPVEDALEPKHLVMCLVMAEKYGIDSFSDFCLQALEEAISVQTACEILALLEEQYENDSVVVVDIITKCYKYIVNNIIAIIQEDTLYYLSSETFQSILQNPSLSCPEIHLYNAVLDWHQHHYRDYHNHRESLLLHLSKLDLKLIDLNSLAQRVHASGVFSKDEMAELYRLRISLGQFNPYSRNERKFALMFHAGSEFNSRPNDVIASLNKAGIDICSSDIINFSDKCTLSYQDLQQYSAILLFSMETRSQGSCGDVLADYVDKGGCLVMCHALGCVSGRIMTNAYLPVQRQDPHDGDFRALQLGKLHPPFHPLFEGVSDLRVRCGLNFVWNCKVSDDARLLAEWSDGTPLACERECGKGRILFLNLYPVSTRVVIVGLEKDCDGRIHKRKVPLARERECGKGRILFLDVYPVFIVGLEKY